MTLPKTAVSICLPTFNGEKHLECAIESVLAQSFKDFELVVVDDCSSDASFAIAQNFASRDPRVKSYKNESRKGLFANYNECISHASSEFIKPFAQDDLLHPNYLNVALDRLNNNPDVSLFAATRNWIDDTGKDISETFNSPSISDYFLTSGPIDGDIVIRKSLETLVNFIGEPVCVTFRRQNPPVEFDENLLHLGDLDMWLRLLRSGRFDYTDEVLCSFRRHNGSETDRNLESLAVVPDVMQLYNKLSAYTNNHEEFSPEFLDKSVKLISDQFKHCVTNREVRSNVIKNLSRSDLEVLSSQALLMIGDRQEIEREADRLSDVTARLENKLRNYLSDPFWKATRPFRETKKLFSVKNKSVEEKPEVGFNQKRYHELLKRKIIAVKLSRTFLLKSAIERSLKFDFSSPYPRKSPIEKLKRLQSRRANYKRDIESPVKSNSLTALIEENILNRDNSLAVPEISVLIGFMRHSPTQALTELMRQSLSFDRYEVICVDASGCESIERDLKQWANTNNSAKNFHIVKTAQAGRAFANNLAWRLARAPITILLASDFIPGHNFIESHLHFHLREKDNKLIAIGGAEFDNNGSKSGFQKWLDESGVVFGVPFSGQDEIPDNFFYAANTSFHKELLYQAGMFDEDFTIDAWDDYELGLRLTNLGSRSVYLKDAFCKHSHGVTFLERLKLMKEAASAAVTFDLKNHGDQPWHQNIEKSNFTLAASAVGNFKNLLVTGNKSYMHKFWEESLEAAFSKSYKDRLESIRKQNLSELKG